MALEGSEGLKYHWEWLTPMMREMVTPNDGVDVNIKVVHDPLQHGFGIQLFFKGEPPELTRPDMEQRAEMLYHFLNGVEYTKNNNSQTLRAGIGLGAQEKTNKRKWLFNKETGTAIIEGDKIGITLAHARTMNNSRHTTGWIAQIPGEDYRWYGDLPAAIRAAEVYVEGVQDFTEMLTSVPEAE